MICNSIYEYDNVFGIKMFQKTSIAIFDVAYTTADDKRLFNDQSHSFQNQIFM